MEGKVYDSPFIHLFQTVSGTYFYDVNKDKCVPVPGEIYEYLERGMTDWIRRKSQNISVSWKRMVF